MKLEIYVIKDTVVGQFMNPFYQHNDGTAIRLVKEGVNAKEPNALQENMGDKQLYGLGTFDTVTGEIASKVKFITNLVDLKEKE